MSLLQDISRIQSYKSVSQISNQIVEMDKLSDKEVMKIFYRFLPSNVLKIGPFYIFYLLKDADPVLWDAMIEYIRIFYDQTCREKISTSYKKSFKYANLMVLCMSHDTEIYNEYEMDLLNGFLIANYDVPKKEANIILICFQDIYQEGQKFKLGAGLFLHCLALNILTQLHIKDVYLEASDKNLIRYYGNIGYKLGKSPCGKRDKITDIYNETQDIDEIIQRLPTNYADEKFGYAYRMKWCGFDERDICFKAFRMFRENIGNVKDEMLKSKMSLEIESEDEFVGPKKDPKRYKILKLILDKDYYKEYYGVMVGDKENQLIKIHIYSKEIDKKNLDSQIKCIEKSSHRFCNEIPCFIESFEVSDGTVVITTARDGYESLEEYLTKRYRTRMMDGEKMTKNISRVLNDMYSLGIVPKISEKSIGIFPDTLEIYIPHMNCNGDEKKNKLFIQEIYDTIVGSNGELEEMMKRLVKTKDDLIRRVVEDRDDLVSRLNKILKKFGEKVNEHIFKSYQITDDVFVGSTKRKLMDKVIENIDRLHDIMMNHEFISYEWRNEWLKLLERM